MKIPWLNIEKLNDSSIEVKVFNSSAICFNEESKDQQEEKSSKLIETRDLICSENIGESSLHDNTGQYSNPHEHSVPKYILCMSKSPVIVIPHSKIVDENTEEKPLDSHLGQSENQIYEEKIKNSIDFINIRVPVVVGEYKISVCMEEPIVFKERVLRIKDISNSVSLQNFKFIPTYCSSVSENGTSTALKGKLLLDGLLHQNIEYTTAWDDESDTQEKHNVISPVYSYSLPQTVGKNEQINTKNKIPNLDFNSADNDHNDYLEKICSMTKEISFSTMVEIDEFLRPLIVGDNIKNSFEFLDRSIHSDSHIHTKLLNEKVSYIEEPYCCLIESEINEDITLINHVYDSKVCQSSLFEQKIALEVCIHLLQVQTIRGQ